MQEDPKVAALLADRHITETIAKADAAREKGMAILFKWTCEGCGERATSGEVNDLYASYVHDDCGYETQTINGDLGFATILSLGANRNEYKNLTRGVDDDGTRTGN